MPRPLPKWVPQEDPNHPNPEDTGWVPVSSSWIAGLKLTPERGVEMTVKKGGKTYPYPGFNLDMFRKWVGAQSKGKWWWNNIGYPMKDAEPTPAIKKTPRLIKVIKQRRQIKASRWTGPVHPLFDQRQTGQSADGPMNWDRYSDVTLDQILNTIRNTGHQLPERHLAALAGWLPGTTTHASYVHSGYPVTRYRLATSDPRGNYTATRYLEVPNSQHAPLSLENVAIDIPDRTFNIYKGASGPLLLRQMRAAYEAGIPRISFSAALSEPQDTGHGYIGGLHWPLIGADGFLPSQYVRQLPQDIVNSAEEASGGEFGRSRQIQHFFMSPKAKAYYIENPTSHDAFVDTTPGSYSRKAIEHHVAANAMRHGNQPPIPDEQLPKVPLQFMRRHKRHPMTEYLVNTGELHPDYFDDYFEN